MLSWVDKNDENDLETFPVCTDLTSIVGWQSFYNLFIWCSGTFVLCVYPTNKLQSHTTFKWNPSNKTPNFLDTKYISSNDFQGLSNMVQPTIKQVNLHLWLITFPAKQVRLLSHKIVESISEKTPRDWGFHNTHLLERATHRYVKISL